MQCLPDVILRRSFTRPSTALGDWRPGNEVTLQLVISLTPRPMTMVFWFGNETMCAHAYKSLKMASQPTGSSSSVLWAAGKSWIGVTEARDQGKFLLRYESFSCYNHGEYLSHSQDIFIGERIRKMAFLLPHTFVFSCLPQGFWESILVFLII